MVMARSVTVRYRIEFSLYGRVVTVVVVVLVPTRAAAAADVPASCVILGGHWRGWEAMAQPL